MKTHVLGADQFIEFIFTHDRNEMYNEVNFNCGNTDEIENFFALEFAVA